MAKAKTKKQEDPIEKKLWAAADKLRKNIDAAEYKHVVLGLVFLRYISEAFEAVHERLLAEVDQGADPEDQDEYLAKNVFFVPKKARWSTIRNQAKSPTIGTTLDGAMDAIEKQNPQLKSVLPKVYARQNLDATVLGELVDMFTNINLTSTQERSADVLGHIFEYFLGEFALAEGKQGGQFYTPRSVVELLVEMLEPKKGRIYDPCCGSGGMFVQSQKFVDGHTEDISIYGQESNLTTWRLAKMNLAIRGIDSSNLKWNSEGSFLNDAHPDLRADYVIANPPFNVSDWSGEALQEDARWKFGPPPPAGNANYAWLQHFLYHLAPKGQVGVVLAKGALTSNSSGEGEIRKALIEAGKIDCIVNLPGKIFLNTQIPASLWFMSNDRTDSRYRDRSNEILFIDARNLGHLINRRTRELSDEDIFKISDTYHNWRNVDGTYEDIPGFCSSASLERVQELGYVLTPGRYVGMEEVEDDFDFGERFEELQEELAKQMKEEQRLNAAITEQLGKIEW
ncbi:class I SAM-dependent DNA methyltransferase [Lewinella sp. 4G2]|uniref:type I restriction-modification system subunit M n=1 Tax=Lewinella sp. 4G2 TaxID=1803372 RepID=UPI0007B4CB69|nr:class I SAM-dependent DNA methyltransferase [Lewinella sp. 4G2]OAV43958.1 DNA methyltransferase [Lewinella sp. 4G2]